MHQLSLWSPRPRGPRLDALPLFVRTLQPAFSTASRCAEVTVNPSPPPLLADPYAATKPFPRALARDRIAVALRIIREHQDEILAAWAKHFSG